MIKPLVKRRNTPAKKAILDMLEISQTALSQDMIEEEMKGKMDRVTMYRILNAFCEDGIAHKVVSDEGKTYYALCNNCENEKHYHDHFHFKCLRCSKVECLKDEIQITLPQQYTSVNVNCWVSGYCSQCH